MTAGMSVRVGVLLIAMAIGLSGCHRNGGEGMGGLLGLGSPQAPAAGSVGYVDVDAVVAAHPLHTQLQAMQDQITLLQQESSLVPTDMTPQQTVAYNQMQDELSAAATKFQADLAARRTYYEQKEAQAISQLQATTLGANPDTGGVLGGLQQQFGSQAKAMQQQAFSTLNNYRNALFKQDADHLRNVQQLLAAEVRGKLSQRASQLSSQETQYQVGIVKADQELKLNLQAKLQDLALSDKERAQDNEQLQTIEQNEQTKIDAMKSRDNAQLAQFTKQLQVQASARYEAERKATQDATQAKLVARQKDVQTQMQPQLVALNGKFQQQLNAVNQKLANNPKYQAQAQSVHNQMQSGYVAEANQATTAYEAARAALVTKYSSIARMQFQDNEAISAQADKVAAERRDLYQKIVDQIAAQVQDIARSDGFAIVLTGVRGAGSAINLTDRVLKATSALQTTTATPQASGSGGS